MISTKYKVGEVYDSKHSRGGNNSEKWVYRFEILSVTPRVKGGIIVDLLTVNRYRVRLRDEYSTPIKQNEMICDSIFSFEIGYH